MHTQSAPIYMAPTFVLDSRIESASPLTLYTVALIVLLAFASVIAAAVLVWCVVHGQHLVVFWRLGANNIVTIACQ